MEKWKCAHCGAELDGAILSMAYAVISDEPRAVISYGKTHRLCETCKAKLLEFLNVEENANG